jgi:hypothetical protein
VPFVEDFTVFFADFGVAAVPFAREPITVIFDRAHIEAMGGDISGTHPVALAVSADVSCLEPHEDSLAIAGSAHVPPRAEESVTYKILDIQPDGTGLSTVLLEEVC